MSSRLTLPLAALLAIALPLRAADPPTSQSAPNFTFPISKIVPAYYREYKDGPALADLLKSTVTLAIVDDVYTAPTADHKGQPIPLGKIGSDTPGGAAYLDSSAVDHIYQAIIDFYNKDHHIIGAFTVVDSKDIGENDKDLRTDRTTLTFIIVLSRITAIHTRHYHPATDAMDTDAPADAAILKNSPIQPDSKSATDLIHKDLLDDYLASLNKSHVNATMRLSGSGTLGEVTLEYIIDAPPAATVTATQPN